MTSTSPNPRASLLSGLRTGGVRSASATIPHTAAPGGSFNVPRLAPQLHGSNFPEEEDDQVLEVPASSVFNNHRVPRAPMTAAVDGPDHRFQQQQRGMNPNSVPFSPAFMSQQQQPNPNQAQAFQMQMMQLELMKMQHAQTQQYQAQLLAQAQLQLQAQQQQQMQMQSPRRASYNPPATAGPLTSSFDLRSATLSAQMRRASQGSALDEPVPMTAALGGKFGARPVNMSGRPGGDEYEDISSAPSTTVISGGTSLGGGASAGTPSKSDTASNWRRGGNNNSVLSGNNRSPSVKITPPPIEKRTSPPPPAALPSSKVRPMPLRLNAAVSQPMASVSIDTNEAADNDDVDAESVSSHKSSNSNPTTPPSASSTGIPLSPREEASRKLYEGLGIERSAPVPTVVIEQPPMTAPLSKMGSQPVRQPRGPPSGADELGPKNFAARIRRQAIGGLMNLREKRDSVVEAF
ncbi:unnamed protein product [Mycena citricolor]|uniref:Uncharacterized protein n=1 Tax=Mycena citricolor TaxID=2018698 RepID=A0AAD2GSB1_9AGAR|nr:unnamed protein product [Mycena citricolor]